MFGLGNKNNNIEETKQGEKLSISNLIEENEKLECANELLIEQVNKQDDLLFSITQENALMSERIEELEEDIKEYERIGKDSGVREQREIYKKTINVICDKFVIDHQEVFNIIDSITEKNNKNEREK